MAYRDISDILLSEGTLFELYASKGYDQTLAALRIAEDKINARILAIGGDTWTKRKLNEIKALIQKEISASYGGLFEDMQNESVSTATITAGAIAGNVNQKLPTSAINDIISSNREIQLGMIDNKVPQMYTFKEIFNLQEDEHIRAMKRVISAGVAQGLVANTIVRNMGIANRKETKKLERNIFTVIADSRQRGNAEAYKELERLGVNSYYEHLSVLDSKTSVHICVPRDGRRYYQKWENIGQQNIPPLHMNCRSLLSLRTGSDLSDTRPSQFGEIKDLTYKEWFPKQPDWFQKQVLGKKKFDLFKNGQFKINGLPDIGNKKLNINDIKSSLDRYSQGD